MLICDASGSVINWSTHNNRLKLTLFGSDDEDSRKIFIGIHLAISKMCVGEIAWVLIPSSYHCVPMPA
jgi:hypothetical protein